MTYERERTGPERYRRHIRQVLDASPIPVTRRASGSRSHRWTLSPTASEPGVRKFSDDHNPLHRLFAEMTLGELKSLVQEFGAELSIDVTTSHTSRARYSAMSGRSLPRRR
jgi:hypothetical protein